MQIDMQMPCPICSIEGYLKMYSQVDEIPYFGEHTQVTLLCDKCGWRQTDFIPADGKKPGACSLVISHPDHLSVRIVRSSSCTISIPELDLEVSPGNDGAGYVSNVEGIIQRFEEVVLMLQRDMILEKAADDGDELSDSLATCERLISTFANMRTEKITNPITIELLDPRGHSQILHPDTMQRELTEEEMRDLPVGPDPTILSPDDV